MSSEQITLTDAEIRAYLMPAASILAAMRPYDGRDRTPHGSAVYFLSDGPALVYVGSSREVDRRLHRHWVQGEKKFDRFHTIAVPPEMLFAIEGFYIITFGIPYYNARVLPYHHALRGEIAAALDGTLWAK